MSLLSEHLLSVLVFLPVVGALAAAVTGRGAVTLQKVLGLAFSTVGFLLSLGLVHRFEDVPNMQFVERADWIPAWGISYHLGVDGLSLWLVILTTFLTPLCLLGSWKSIENRVREFVIFMLLLEAGMIGVFAALDLFLFYVFWEAMLIPMFIIIGVWGGPRRIYATLKFFLYTFLGSVLMLVALIYLYMGSGSYAIQDYYTFPLGMREQLLIFIAFLTAFAVKVPMWPVHTWLPDAHVEAPTGGSVILAAIMLKMGGYGFVRFSLPITPDASMSLDWLVLMLSLIAVVYIGFVALVQSDMKKLIAYSSIAHMGFVTLGFFIAFAILRRTGGLAGAGMGIEGGMVQMISHGLVSGALFLCVGVLYDRLHSRDIAAYGGVANTMPRFAALMVFFAMANAGLPGTSGFVGEFLVILASFKANPWFAFLAATTLVLGAAYTLWMVKRVIFGDVANEGVAGLNDIDGREGLVLGVLAAAVLILGVWPAPLLDVMGPTVQNLLDLMMRSKL
jgi:NADH-quinone oxidoreductase subunit M